MVNNFFDCKVSISISCSVCADTHIYCYEDYKWEPGMVFRIPQLPLKWNRVNDYLFCPMHRVEVRNNEDVERERQQEVEAAKLRGAGDSNLEQLMQMISLLKKDRQINGSIWKLFQEAMSGDRG